jgi:hypothetical protein
VKRSLEFCSDLVLIAAADCIFASVGLPPFPNRKGAKYSRWVNSKLVEILPKDKLIELYYKDKLSTKQIALTSGVAQSTIWRLFERYGLKTRTLQESMDLKRKPSTRYKRVRLRALNLLGGRCVHCGRDDLRILEIHHKEGGGRRERRLLGGDGFYYGILMKRRRIDNLEVCCRPCHAVQDIKRVYGVDNFLVEWREI